MLWTLFRLLGGSVPAHMIRFLRAVFDFGNGGQAHVRRDAADVVALGQFVSESYY